MAYDDFLTEDRRLTILKLLAESNGYELNEYTLQSALDQFGHAVSGDRLRADLAWLAEQDLLRITTPGDIQVARATARGLDVAAGRAHVPGVKKPRPE